MFNTLHVKSHFSCDLTKYKETDLQKKKNDTYDRRHGQQILRPFYSPCVLLWPSPNVSASKRIEEWLLFCKKRAPVKYRDGSVRLPLEDMALLFCRQWKSGGKERERARRPP